MRNILYQSQSFLDAQKNQAQYQQKTFIDSFIEAYRTDMYGQRIEYRIYEVYEVVAEKE
jgi:hypothetical protein